MKSVSALKSNFQLSVESNPRLDWVCFTLLCHWSRNLYHSLNQSNAMGGRDLGWVTCRFLGRNLYPFPPSGDQEEFLVKIYSIFPLERNCQADEIGRFNTEF